MFPAWGKLGEYFRRGKKLAIFRTRTRGELFFPRDTKTRRVCPAPENSPSFFPREKKLGRFCPSGTSPPGRPQIPGPLLHVSPPVAEGCRGYVCVVGCHGSGIGRQAGHRTHTYPCIPRRPVATRAIGVQEFVGRPGGDAPDGKNLPRFFRAGKNSASFSGAGKTRRACVSGGEKQAHRVFPSGKNMASFSLPEILAELSPCRKKTRRVFPARGKLGEFSRPGKLGELSRARKTRRALF